MIRLAIGLDIGSSSIKGALLDLDTLKIGATAGCAFPLPVPGSVGRHEVDADQVVSRCRAVIDDLSGPAAPDALFICGQQGGCVPVDPATRRAIGNYISWRDQRTGEPHPDNPRQSFHDRLRDDIGDEHLANVGHELAPGGTVALAAWLADNTKLPRRTAMVGIGEYVLARLTDTNAVIERTCAVGMTDFTTLHSPTAMYQRIGLDQFTWPRLVEFRECIGLVRIGGRDVQAYPVVGDHQCALAGASLAERELSINVSTGSQVALLARLAETSPRYQTRSYFDGLFLKTVTHLPAGRAINAFVDLLCELPRREGRPVEEPWAIIAPLLDDSSADTDLRVRATLFKGPLGDRGAIENISLSNLTVGSLMRAALVGLAGNYRQASAWIGATPDAATWDGVVLSGGIAQKFAPLRKAIAAQFPNRPIRLSRSKEETLQGLMAIALVNSGRASSVTAALTLRPAANG